MSPSLPHVSVRFIPLLRSLGLIVISVFTKLASQLTTDKLADLAIIPVIFMVQTLISYIGSIAVAKVFGFSKRPRNFVIAMGASRRAPRLRHCC